MSAGSPLFNRPAGSSESVRWQWSRLSGHQTWTLHPENSTSSLKEWMTRTTFSLSAERNDWMLWLLLYMKHTCARGICWVVHYSSFGWVWIILVCKVQWRDIFIKHVQLLKQPSEQFLHMCLPQSYWMQHRKKWTSTSSTRSPWKPTQYLFIFF